MSILLLTVRLEARDKSGYALSPPAFLLQILASNSSCDMFFSTAKAPAKGRPKFWGAEFYTAFLMWKPMISLGI